MPAAEWRARWDAGPEAFVAEWAEQGATWAARWLHAARPAGAGLPLPALAVPDTLPALGAVETRDRALVESELSRVLRVLVPQLRRENAGDAELQGLVNHLVTQWYRTTIARSAISARSEASGTARSSG